MADDKLEEILAWLNEAGVEVQSTEHGSVLLRDVVSAVTMRVMALEKRVAELERR